MGLLSLPFLAAAELARPVQALSRACPRPVLMARRMAPSGDVAAAAGFQNHPVFATHRHEVPMSSLQPSPPLLETMMLIRAHEERLAMTPARRPAPAPPSARKPPPRA